MVHSDFVHLHLHTDYSLLDGACQIDKTLELAKGYKMPALAITDHGNMFGAIEFYKKAQKAGIKPIVGSEVYVASGDRRERKAAEGIPSGSFHLILLARDNDGYHNLMRLSTAGYMEGFYYHPRIDKDILTRHSKGLIGLSSCLKGEIAHYVLAGDLQRAKKAAQFYQDLLGEEGFYLELMDLGLEESRQVNSTLVQMGKEMGIPLVATNDCHYLRREDAEAHDILLCLQTGKDREDPKRLRFRTNQIYFRSPQEMKELFRDHPEAIRNTIEIAERCNLQLKLDPTKVHLPHYPLPEGYESSEEYLKYLVSRGLEQRYSKVTPAIEERVKYELETIEHMGFSGYFLIIKDIVDRAKAEGIPVGPGRGSDAGSLAAYALGITGVDPLKYDLIFERFLNPERVSMPDFDIDFGDTRRDGVIEYTIKKYGKDSVSQIITFGTLAARAAIRDVGRVLKIPYSDVDRIAKLIPFGSTIEEAIDSVVELKALIESDERYGKLIEVSRKLEGLARHASTHAAGLVIAPGTLTDYVPLFRSPEGAVSTQYAMESLEDLGLLKVDFLGLRTLTVIQETVEMLKEREVLVEVERIPLTDKKTFELLSEAETVGVFQLESSGMRDILKKLRPTVFEDLIAVLSLFRPGPLGGLDRDEFIGRRHGKRRISYDHPKLESILKDTYGIILYQDQVMKIASAIAGFSLGEADILRRAMGKKKLGVMDEKRIAFVEGAKKRGVSEESAQKIFDLMVPFAGYGFNKSHSTAYALISYWTAYLKANHPVEFMAASLTSEMGDSDKVNVLAREVKRMGIEILPPNVNESDFSFRPHDRTIRFGLGAVKNVGRGAVEEILRARTDGAFSSLFDLTRRIDLRVVNKRVIESLIKAGAFDSVDSRRATLSTSVERAFEKGVAARKERERQQVSLFGPMSKEDLDEHYLVVEDWALEELLSNEKEALGFYFSGHPLDRFRGEVKASVTCETGELKELPEGSRVTLGGIIVSKREIKDRKGRNMGFFTLEDFQGTVEVVVFPELFLDKRSKIKRESAILVSGRASEKRGKGEAKLIAEKISSLPLAKQEMVTRVELEVTDSEEPLLLSLKDLLLSSPGDCEVVFHVAGEAGSKVGIRSKSIRVTPTEELIRGIRELVGEGRVRLVRHAL